jgi:hypothetical protein
MCCSAFHLPVYDNCVVAELLERIEIVPDRVAAAVPRLPVNLRVLFLCTVSHGIVHERPIPSDITVITTYVFDNFLFSGSRNSLCSGFYSVYESRSFTGFEKMKNVRARVVPEYLSAANPVSCMAFRRAKKQRVNGSE